MSAVPDIYLGIGDLHFCAAPARIRTVLGSCISITLWHPVRRVGGMCHFMLPGRNRRPEQALDGRYGDEAMAIFDQEMARYGTRPADYRAKVFGGGNMFPDRPQTGPKLDVGQRNIEVTHRLLAERGIRIIAEHLGGDGHRKLIFDVSNGNAWMAFQDAGEPTRRRK
ncbi:chemotaxis protein CheD [Pseudothauera rhizosphaerae]|uniref:Probable chemoreceptor glutamine deamidase CheD n=1 Tax=Pseudothauera rhizosphaerae TaxID=2565932 RepID=A0A4S4B0C5_9RHOO|nr:chemotaxis protein CheD [Pseudothauera rhizosphaerae]THF65074.1 chemotaxis protein CheD [Pseudothauera rhizosphaerae]